MCKLGPWDDPHALEMHRSLEPDGLGAAAGLPAMHRMAPDRGPPVHICRSATAAMMKLQGSQGDEMSSFM